MDKIKLLILILTSINLASCYKGHNGLVEGTVTLKSTNTPIKDVTIRITESYSSNQDYQIAIGTTDENGHYKIYYNHTIYRSYRQYILIAIDSLYYKEEIKKNKSKIDISL